MTTRVLAVGLDAADPDLLRGWMDEGRLPVLAGLRDRGQFGQLRNVEQYKAETPWTTFLTGTRPLRHGYYGPIAYDPRTTSTREVGAYDYQEIPPFYAGTGLRVAVVDVPQARVVPGVRGVQVLGWGAHSQQGPQQSDPPHLLDELVRDFGPHPTYAADHVSCYDDAAIARLQADLVEGAGRRAKICVDLLRRARWDLFLTVFAETHSGPHCAWHHGLPHPLGVPGTAVADVYAAVDAALGEVLAAAPDATVVVFSPHGMQPNNSDLPGSLFLPELLHRWAFGQPALVGGGDGTCPSHWKHVVWGLRDRHGARELADPRSLKDAFDPLAWQPAEWYSPLWSRMRAFALPTYGEGTIRVNLVGREGHGIVPVSEYDAVCAEVEKLVLGLRDAHTGEPLVAGVDRTRPHATDRHPKRPPADLVVRWRGAPTDTAVHPLHGRIGPFPHFRPGGHRAVGFVLAAGPGIGQGTLPEHAAWDLPPTILALLGAPVPETLDGAPIALG